MAINFKCPEAKELLGELNKCLQATVDYNPSKSSLTSSHPFVQIPELVERLWPYLGKKRLQPVSLWRCFVALDKARPGLRLVRIVSDVFESISKIPPGPLTRLIKMANSKNGPFNEADKVLLGKLREHMENTSEKDLNNIEDYYALLTRVESDRMRRISSGFSMSRQDCRSSAWIKFLDFYREFNIWISKYQETIETALGVVSHLGNEKFEQLLRKVSYGEGCVLVGLTEARSTRLAAVRQSKRRHGQPRDVKTRSRPRGEMRNGDWYPKD